jgi:Phosphodiester glycosidase
VLRPEPRRSGRPAGAYGPESHQPGPYEPGRNESDRYGAPRYEYGPAPVPPETPYGPTGVPYGGIAAPFDELELPEDPGGPGGPGGPPGPRGPRDPERPRRRPGRGRIRRFFRLRTVRVILALFAVFLCWVAFSVGQALTAPGGGSTSAKLAEWARDHYLGPVVTFGEWISYNPPKVGGKPGFSLAVPSSSATHYKKTKSFQPNIPLKLTSPAGQPLPGEGRWRLLETVKNEPAIFSTFLRADKVHTSVVAGIVSLDQRLVTFGLRPGVEDPGPGNWKASTWLPPGTRRGLLATFNGGFKLDSAGGGFYLNGKYKGTLVKGAATVVYYRDGTIKIGSWGSELRMTPNVVGVRQNLKLLIDQGQVSPKVNSDVLSNWGATLGGGYYVWRSGIGITQGGRIIFVYGPSLNVQDLANLLHRAGAVEGMQLDINPEWMSFDYYQAGNTPQDPAPHALLPTQQGSAYRYFQPYSRDFTVVYSR